MKKNESLQNEVLNTKRCEPLLETPENGTTSKVSKNLRKLFYVANLAGMGLIFNACMTGYVATEPSYIVMYRPPQPSNVHIWIDGDWAYNYQTRGYVQKTGYWEQPRQGQTYVSGYWQSSPQGKYWKNGHWQKQNNHNGRNH